MTDSVPKGVRCALALALLAFARNSPAQSPSDALALEQQGKFAESAEVWQAIVKRTPRDAGAYASLGVDLARQQKYVEAAGAYKKALSLNPKLPGIHLNFGLAEFKQGHFEAAISPFSKALAAQPNNAQHVRSSA